MNWSQPHFAEPRWLWLAIVGPLLLLALQRYSAWARGKQLARVATPAFLEILISSHSPGRRVIKEVFLLVALCGIGLAMARPQWGEQAEGGTLLGQDVVFILDCSRSMLATDIPPSRLQRAKLAILDFVQRQGKGRVGLVAFAGQAFLQCPLTYDYNAFQESLNLIDDRTIPIPGTDLGRGLDEGFRALEKNSRQKLLVLITDGEDLEKSGVRMAESLGKQGVVIYTIGVGTPAGSEIQFLTDQGKTEILRDAKGEIVHSHLDESTLRSVAEAAHGDYFRLGPLGEGMARVRVAADKSNSLSSASAGRKFGVDRFYLPLAAALVLLVIEPLAGTRRRATT
jgi:Ca-activated chloride channel family protein